jgi:predicted RNase H-like HicB family nuclease
MSTFTAVLHKEDDTYVAECPEVGMVSQGKTVEEAVNNLKKRQPGYISKSSDELFSSPGSKNLSGSSYVSGLKALNILKTLSDLEEFHRAEKMRIKKKYS